MAISRKVLIVGALGVAAVALIGAGAGATFSDSVNATQKVTAGTMNLQITNGGGGTVTPDGKTVTLPAFGPTGSTFLTDHRVLTVTNNGNIPVTTLAFQMNESHDGNNANNNALLAQTYVCIQSTDLSGGPWTEGNGPLSTGVFLQPSVVENAVHLVPGQSMTFSVEFYAGRDSSCNSVSSDGTNTKAAWDQKDGGPYHTPASLTNAAQGGVITPTLTFSFTG